MDNKEYVREVVRTESCDGEKIKQRAQSDRTIRLVHAALGLCTEAGEFLDAIKRHLFYGTEIDETNLIEELGDLSWYMAIAIDALGTNIETVQEVNAQKLKLRYPDKFTNDKAIQRDPKKERKLIKKIIERSTRGRR